jgi:hypothetical protein
MNSEYDAYIQQLLQGASGKQSRLINSNQESIGKGLGKLGGVLPQSPGGAAPPPSAPMNIPMPHYSQGWAFQGHPTDIPAPMQPLLKIDLTDAKKKKKDD